MRLEYLSFLSSQSLSCNTSCFVDEADVSWGSDLPKATSCFNREQGFLGAPASHGVRISFRYLLLDCSLVIWAQLTDGCSMVSIWSLHQPWRGLLVCHRASAPSSVQGLTVLALCQTASSLEP